MYIVARNNVLVHHTCIVLVYRPPELCRVQTELTHCVTVTLQWAVGQLAAVASGRRAVSNLKMP